MRTRDAVWDAAHPWHDEPGDPLVDQLGSLAAIDAGRYDAGVRAARRRPIVLAVFREALASRMPRTSRAPFGRRLAFAAAAAVLLLSVGAGALLASGPGRPLYGLRLAAEVALLPSDDVERLEAQMGRLDARLDEAAAGRVAGDDAAFSDALRAYSAILEEMRARPVPEEPYRSRAMARLNEQLTRIEAIGGGMEPADAAASARAMIAWLNQGGQGGSGPEPSPRQTPGGTETPAASPRPQPTPGPSPDPSPHGSGGPSGPDGSGGPHASVEPGPSHGQGGGEGSGGEGGGAGDSWEGEEPGAQAGLTAR